MTGTLPARTADAAPIALDEPTTVAIDRDDVVAHGDRAIRETVAIRPWSALVCGLPEDRTLLVVDWLLLACREAGLVGQAVPLATGTGAPHGMYVEIAADEDVESHLGELPWGAVDLVVAGEHLELMRAIDAGFVDRDATTVVASCRRSYTAVERTVVPQHVLDEQEIDALASERARAYHAFDGHEVARWYHLPVAAQPGLLLGAVCGTGVTGLDEAQFVAAIRELGIDASLHGEAFRRGTRLGRREGGRVRRVRTAYQFTRRRRAIIDHRSRRSFEELVERAEQLVHPSHRAALQEAVFQLCEFQDAEWATRLVEHVAELAQAERALLGTGPLPHRSIVPDAIRSLASMLVWPDAAWIANRKRRPERIAAIRTASGIGRRDSWELVDHIPLDELDRDAAKSRRLPGMGVPDAATPPLLQPLRVERIRTTTVAGSLRLRRLAASARMRPGSTRQQHELDTAATWLEAMHDALRVDHELARIVARSGTLVQGSGAVREAHRATAHAFWGRIVRQAIALDRTADVRSDAHVVSALVVPFVWEQLCRSGSLALWEYAAQVLGIALARSRGLSWVETVAMVETLCVARRPVEGA